MCIRDRYYFLYTDSEGEGRFPETGSYQVGQACDNPSYGWVPWQFGVTGRDDLTEDELGEDLEVTGMGCSSAGSAPPGWVALGFALVLGWRRRDSGEADFNP